MHQRQHQPRRRLIPCVSHHLPHLLRLLPVHRAYYLPCFNVALHRFGKWIRTKRFTNAGYLSDLTLPRPTANYTETPLRNESVAWSVHVPVSSTAAWPPYAAQRLRLPRHETRPNRFAPHARPSSVRIGAPWSLTPVASRHVCSSFWTSCCGIALGGSAALVACHAFHVAAALLTCR